MTRLSFFGAAGEVTGSCTMVETGNARFLVDCGMFQGGSEARLKNQQALEFDGDVRDIDFVLLTHAHIDHSGLLPRLSVLGYRGLIYTTAPDTFVPAIRGEQRADEKALGEAVNTVMADYLSIPPTISVNQGAVVMIRVDADLAFY